jgi:hypothetical protein
VSTTEDIEIKITIPCGCGRIIAGFARCMGLSTRDAARHLLMRAATDLAASPGFRDPGDSLDSDIREFAAAMNGANGEKVPPSVRATECVCCGQESGHSKDCPFGQ